MSDATAVSKERRIVGPPGTGKTTRLAHLCEEMAKKYGSDNILVCSLTRTAAAAVAEKEIDGHKIPIPRQNIGTLHAFAYRAMENPPIADTPKMLAEWNEWIVAQGHPTYRIDPKNGNGLDDAATEATQMQSVGDAYYSEYCICRARLQPLPENLMGFVQLWEQFKSENGACDFSELLDRAYDQIPCAPGDPAVILVDEAQDFSFQAIRLLRKWAESEACQEFILVGDPLQNLFHWAGSDTEAFTTPELPTDRVEILEQSYRVPAAAHEVALRWIQPLKERVEAQIGKEIVYRPRVGRKTGTTVQGRVRRLAAATYKYPEPAINDAIANYLGDDKFCDLQVDSHDQPLPMEVMFITACSHMLQPLINALRKLGIPYHNIYRPTRGDWNPLAVRGQTASARLLNFMRINDDAWPGDARFWNARELWSWVEVIEAKGLLKRGAKDQIKAAADVGRVDGEHNALDLSDLNEWFERLDDVLDLGDLVAASSPLAYDWFMSRILAAKKKSFEFPMTIAQRQGLGALRRRPRVTVGTIHCSPPDEPVLTTSGYVPIGELDPNVHRLASYNHTCNRMTWGPRKTGVGTQNVRKGDGFSFMVNRNPYFGRIITVATEKSRTRVTPDHRMRVRFSESFYDKWAVYLMRKGDLYRIGICATATRPYKCGTLHTRMSTEQADAGWILGIFDNRKDALREEAYLQGRYGIPSLTFFADEKTRVFKSDELIGIHESMKDFVLPRAEQLIIDRGWDKHKPLYIRNGEGRAHAQSVMAFETIAANLIPGYMEIPVADENFHETQWRESGYSTPDWLPVSVSQEYYEGDVYSLDVMPYEFYVSGGAVVHNSLKGAQSNAVYIFPDLSSSGMQNYMRPGPDRDGVLRAFYVAFTRPLNDLILCQRANAQAIQYPQFSDLED